MRLVALPGKGRHPYSGRLQLPLVVNESPLRGGVTCRSHEQAHETEGVMRAGIISDMRNGRRS